MKDGVNVALWAVIVSGLAVLVSAVNLILRSINGLQIAFAVVLLGCNLCIMSVCLLILSKKKKRK